MTDEIIAFKGEAMLLNWAESKHGRTVVFLLDEESDVHPMKAFTTKRGKRAGTRFAMVLVEINDDETPVQQEKKGGPLSKSAAQMCENLTFQKFACSWITNFGRFIPVGANLTEIARQAIIQHCDIKSRAELDHNPEAAKHFHELMREFRAWNERQ